MVVGGVVVVGGMVAGASTDDIVGGAAATTSSSPTAPITSTVPTTASATPASTPVTDRALVLAALRSPIASRPRRSASCTRGGTTTSADSNATPMFTVTTMPKSLSNGRLENISTANPPSVVSAEVKNARPVRSAATRVLSAGSSPRPRSSA